MIWILRLCAFLTALTACNASLAGSGTAGPEPSAAGRLPGGLLHAQQDESGVSARWLGLEHRDDQVGLLAPALTLEIVNESREPVLILPRLRAMTNARITPLLVHPVALVPGAGRAVLVQIPDRLFHRGELLFSGKLHLSLEVIRLGDLGRGARALPESLHQSLPTLYFHRDAGRLMVYREDVMRERFGAGNYRDLPLRLPDLLPAIREDLARAGLGRIRPVLSFMHLAAGFPDPNPIDDILPPGSRKFCFGLDGSAFLDSAAAPTLYFSGPAEDFGRHDAFVPARRAWVALGQQGNPLYSGSLDAEGCTPYVIPAEGPPLSVAFFPLFQRTADNVRGFVSDLNLGPQWPDAMPFYLFWFDASQAPVTNVFLDPLEYVQTLYVAAANAMERAPGGVEDALYEFRLRLQGDDSGTNTFYANEGHPQVRVKYSAAALQKFTIAHEYGHALHIAMLDPPLTSGDLDYSVSANEAEQHTVTSKEWQLTAAFEGFAQFVSGIVWNEAARDQGAIFKSGSTAYPLDDFTRSFETRFDPALYPDQGVELDWAQFFWNYHTDLYPVGNQNVPAPTVPQLLEIWLESQPWPVQQGFFEDFRDGVEAVLPVLEPGVPIQNSLQRFDAIAAAAGIDH